MVSWYLPVSRKSGPNAIRPTSIEHLSASSNLYNCVWAEEGPSQRWQDKLEGTTSMRNANDNVFALSSQSVQTNAASSCSLSAVLIINTFSSTWSKKHVQIMKGVR